MARDGQLITEHCTITVTPGKSDWELGVKQLCQRALPGWNILNVQDIKISKISGGISNVLSKVTPPASSGLRPVAAKVFGDKTELLIDRELEQRILLALNTAGLGAPVVAVFTNGRVEEFLWAKTLSPEEMCSPRFIPRIAAKLRHMHGLQLGFEDMPPIPTLFGVIYGWLVMARGLAFEDVQKQEAYEQIDFHAFEKEIRAVEAACKAVDSPCVFAHNDLLSGNILIIQDSDPSAGGPLSDDGPMQFIDFEYSAYSYRGFDFGNHFNEYAGFECDYTRYPNAATQRLFFENYLTADERAAAAAGPGGLDGALDRMSAEANVFALVSHIYWGVWAVVQARYSPIDFDYLGYSAMRWREYYRRKEEFMAEAARLFGSTAVA